MTTPTPDSDRGPRTPRSVAALWGPAAVLVALYLAGAMPLILSGNTSGRGASDALNYHLLAIRTFAAELPAPDLLAYPVTTTPLYHLVLAVVARLLTPSTVVLQLTGALFTIGLIATLARWCAARASPALAIACGLPVVASSYVFQSGVWTLPDNAGWWGVLAILLIALDRRSTRPELLAGAVVLLALVLVRQIHVWTAALLWTAAWFGPDEQRPGLWSRLFVPTPERLRRTLAEAAATLPAFAAVAAFAWLWRGLTPPMFQGMYAGPGWSAPALILAILGGVSVCFTGSWLGGAVRLWRGHRWAIIAAALAGLTVAALPPTTYDTHAGRYSGLWNYADRLGILGGHSSVLVMLLSTAGGACLAFWIASLERRDRWVTLAAFASFAAAQCASPMVWQRYNEPFVLLVCAVLACRVDDAPARVSPAIERVLPTVRWVGPVMLGVCSALLTVAVIAGSRPAEFTPLDPKARQLPPEPDAPKARR